MGVACVAPPRLLLVGMLSASKCSAGRACASVGRTRALGLTRTCTGHARRSFSGGWRRDAQRLQSASASAAHRRRRFILDVCIHDGCLFISVSFYLQICVRVHIMYVHICMYIHKLHSCACLLGNGARTKERPRVTDISTSVRTVQ